MTDLLDGLAARLMQGSLLALLGLSASFVLVGFGYGWGRRAAFREVDEARATVRAAYQQETSRQIARFLPSQRDGGQ